ncbi:MAG TPA: O-antigen ligase family protein [Candidatus Omnitrophota bacterium]|nr:O-antigen ligase family protein [Candidatus Omnitrophota bacterium]
MLSEILPAVFMALFYACACFIFFKRKEYIVYFMCLTVPLYDYFPGIFYKINMFGIAFTLKPYLFCELVLLGVYVLDMIKHKRMIEEIRNINVVFFPLALFGVLALFFTAKERENYFCGVNLCLMILTVAALPYFVKKVSINVNKALRFLILGFFISAVPMMSAIFLSKIGLCAVRYDSFKIYGMTFSIIAIIIIFKYITENDVRRFLKKTGVLFLVFVLIFLTRARASWFSLFFCLPLFAFFSLKYCFARKDRIVLAKTAMVCLVLIAAFFCAVNIEKNIYGEFVSLDQMFDANKHITNNADPMMWGIKNKVLRMIWAYLAHERTMAWQKVFSIMYQNPFLGHGLIYLPTHNIFMEAFLAGGIIGMILFVSGMVSFCIERIHQMFVSRKNLGMYYLNGAFMICIMVWAINGLFQTNLNEYLPWFIIALSSSDLNL